MATKIASATLGSEPHRSLCETLLAEGFCVVPNLMLVSDVALLAAQGRRTDLMASFARVPSMGRGSPAKNIRTKKKSN